MIGTKDSRDVPGRSENIRTRNGGGVFGVAGKNTEMLKKIGGIRRKA